MDPNGDGQASPSDVLFVINRINSWSGGEGEAPSAVIELSLAQAKPVPLLRCAPAAVFPSLFQAEDEESGRIIPAFFKERGWTTEDPLLC